NEIQNHSTTSAEAPNISATPEHHVPDMISKEHEKEVPRKGAKYPMANIAEGNLSNNAKAFAVSLCSEEIPSSFEQALKSEKWKKAMDDEMKALKKNKTWVQCALPQGKKQVGCRWIFTVKYKPDGTVECYKARLVAKGHTQTYRIDYSETFSLVHFKPGEACRLKKSLYGLKQSPRAWFGRFTLAIKSSEVTKRDIHLSEEVHIRSLSRNRMINCKPADTPMKVNQKLFMEKKAKLADRNMYQRLVGKLICLSHTRLDITYAVGVVSWFMHQPHVAHMNEALRIVRYLKEIASHGVLFRSNEHLNIQMYTDADWSGDKRNRRSTLGYFSLVGDLKNPIQHNRIKHVEVDRHFIKEKLEAGIIELPFVKSLDQLADILTKLTIIKSINRVNDSVSHFKNSFVIKVSNGKATRFWLDHWYGSDLRLTDMFPMLYALNRSKECMISDRWVLSNGLEKNIGMVESRIPVGVSLISISNMISGSIASRGCPRSKKIMHGVFCCAIWGISKWRNKIVYAESK
nr:putative ribonuclease H-like domain-containing protein [Tanacetum cinerariifolium]